MRQDGVAQLLSGLQRVVHHADRLALVELGELQRERAESGAAAKHSLGGGIRQQEGNKGRKKLVHPCMT